MLITNFASGELSETLYGRTDLQQYYQGVSRLENFDVIPTGGIHYRNGLKRIATLPEGGRIIPFIIDRDQSYILYLTPNKITPYLNGVAGTPIETDFVNPDGLKLFETLEEIEEVQYAQNFRTLIFAHQNYPPIVLSLGDDLSFTCNTIVINTYVTNVLANVESVDNTSENDKTYLDTGWLKSPGNYPSCVSFFQGRLVFGGTKNNSQRLFFSKVNDYFNFSTYKRFLTEHKEYVSVSCNIVGDSVIVYLHPASEGFKFTSAVYLYTVDSRFYPEGTKAVEINGAEMKLENKAGIEAPMSATETTAFNTWRSQADAWEASPYALRILDSWSGNPLTGPPNIYWIDAYVGSRTITVKATATIISGMSSSTVDYGTLSKGLTTLEAARIRDYPIGDTGAAKDIIRQLANRLLDYTFIHNVTWNETNLTNVSSTLKKRVTGGMFYTFRGKEYTGTPATIYQEIINLTSQGADVYLPFYTSETIEDRYPTAEDGFTFEIASDMSDRIRWITQNKNLLIGTETAEWVVPAGTTAVNVQAILNSRYGSDKVQATSVGDAVVFVQSGRKSLVEYYIPQQDSQFRANNMALMSKNMLHESPAFDFDFISSPYTKIFISRKDGTLVQLLYERSTDTFAWSRITTHGKITSVATLPGANGFDEVYMVIEREGAFFFDVLQEGMHHEKILLDGYQKWEILLPANAYPATASIVDYTDRDNIKVYTKENRPPYYWSEEHPVYIGYPYKGEVISMPVLANDRMKQQNIKNLSIRFHESYLPKVKALPGNEVNTITRKEPYSGVYKVPFPGGWDKDVFFSFIHERPMPCEILAVNAEVN